MEDGQVFTWPYFERQNNQEMEKVMYMNSNETNDVSNHQAHWLRRMGIAGFLFFFLKGMLWLLIPWLAHSTVF